VHFNFVIARKNYFSRHFNFEVDFKTLTISKCIFHGILILQFFKLDRKTAKFSHNKVVVM